jgi:TRAP-type C4-dicarboxylate transport system permease small subunit
MVLVFGHWGKIMPKLIALYIRSVAIGFGLSVAFLGLLLWQDVAGLRHLIFGSDMGWVAAIMVIVFHGIVFAGVQFAIAVMMLADKDDGPKGGHRSPVTTDKPAVVRVTAPVGHLGARRL